MNTIQRAPFGKDAPPENLRPEIAHLAFDDSAAFMEIPTSMSATTDDNPDLVKESLLYKEFLAEREEILRHKWIESEKAGHDVGFEKALLDWIVKHRSSWKDKRKETAG